MAAGSRWSTTMGDLTEEDEAAAEQFQWLLREVEVTR
jgi:hypothetical protein